jgi:hypothetical protein
MVHTFSDTLPVISVIKSNTSAPTRMLVSLLVVNVSLAVYSSETLEMNFTLYLLGDIYIYIQLSRTPRFQGQ